MADEDKQQKQHPDEQWEKSDAKAQIVKDIDAGLVTDETLPRFVLKMHPELYKPWNYDGDFGKRYRSCQKQINKEKEASSKDLGAFLKHRTSHPVTTTTRTGKPRWHGSEAETDMYDDVKAGVHLTMKREDFYKSRASYKVFEPYEVYKHIDQKARRRKRMNEMIRVRDEKMAEEEKKKEKNKNKRSRK